MNVDLDFQRYVERRRGASEAQAREGAAYAYGGDQRVRRTLDSLRPVKLALESTGGFWETTARAELLASAQKASPQKHPAIHAIGQRVAAALHVDAPTIFVSPALGAEAHALGTAEDGYIVLGSALADELNDAELTFVVGAQAGVLQNGHVVYRTAHYYLRRFANRFLQWIVRPATLALDSWVRRADITTDRAGLICARDLDVAQVALLKVGLGTAQYGALDGEGFLHALGDAPEGQGPIEVTELATTHPDLIKRVRALRLFAATSYFRGAVGEEGGSEMSVCDARVAEVLGQ